MINLSTSIGMGYGAGYSYTAGRIQTAGQEGRNPGIRDDEKQDKPRGIGTDEKEDNKIKGLGKDEDHKNKTKGLGKDEDDKNKSKGLGKDKEDKDKRRIITEDEDDPKKECKTCKNRKYKDGSDEMVSFKSPTHISPESAASAVRAHEQEHVSNAYSKASMKNGKVIAASVSIHMGICPECGRTYVAGGTTHTQIKYYNEDNPYQKSLKSADRAKYSGMNLDMAV